MDFFRISPFVREGPLGYYLSSVKIRAYIVDADPVYLYSVLDSPFHSPCSFESGKKGRVDVYYLSLICRKKSFTYNPHIAGQTDQFDFEGVKFLYYLFLESCLGRVVFRRECEYPYSSVSGFPDNRSFRVVTDHKGDFCGDGSLFAGGVNCLEVRSFAACEYSYMVFVHDKVYSLF